MPSAQALTADHILSMAVDTTQITILVATSVIEVVCTLISLFRLVFRLRIRRFWWEDAWAAVATVAAIAYISAALITLINEARNSKINYIARRTSSYAFTTAVWSVRMSLLYSILRVTSPSTSFHRFMRAIGALFIVVFVLLVSLKTWWCDSSKTSPEPAPCVIPYSLSILEVTADFAGDAILVILSLRVLWRIKLPRLQRRMIILSLSSNVVISMNSLLHGIAQMIRHPHLVLISTNMELISSLIVCNLLVVVTYIYRVFTSSSESESSSSSADDDFTTPMTRRTTRSLTAVDLNTIIVETTTTPVTSDQTTQD